MEIAEADGRGARVVDCREVPFDVGIVVGQFGVEIGTGCCPLHEVDADGGKPICAETFVLALCVGEEFAGVRIAELVVEPCVKREALFKLWVGPVSRHVRFPLETPCVRWVSWCFLLPFLVVRREVKRRKSVTYLRRY